MGKNVLREDPQNLILSLLLKISHTCTTEYGETKLVLTYLEAPPY